MQEDFVNSNNPMLLLCLFCQTFYLTASWLPKKQKGEVAAAEQ